MTNLPITVFLSGGFGNVLLQCQFAKYLEKAVKKPIFYNTNFITPVVFKKVNDLLYQPISSKSYRVANCHLSSRYYLAALRRFTKWPFFVEPETDKYIRPQDVRQYLFITGYFQSHKYSSGPLISQEKLHQSVSNSQLCRLAQLSENDVVAHIRFGDYLDVNGGNYHGTMPLSYYTAALKEKFPDRRLIILTDDPDMAKRLFHSRTNQTLQIWSSPEFSAIDDFHLMTCARNIIIGNSSFSYCAALQASRLRSTKVIAPRNWFSNRSIDEVYRFPNDWHLV